MTTKVIFDTDPGIDDAFAALYALSHPKIEVIGITTVFGNVPVEIATENAHKVGVLAVDPTSPFSGGAVLGDRLRMTSSQETGIFIRSVASRGHLGGLAATTRFMINAIEMLDNDLTIIETVGAGQGDVEIVQIADTTVVPSCCWSNH